MYKEGVLDLKKDILTVRSVTIGLKCVKMLSGNNIKAKLIKIDSDKTEHGCRYGIEFKSEDFFNVIALMKDHNIQYSVYHLK